VPGTRAVGARAGEPTWPGTFVDLAPEEERRVIAALDPLGAMATANREVLGSV
jgi:hypothetical protein